MKLLLFVSLCLLPISAGAASLRYHIISLGTPRGYKESRATCMNDKGQVAGYVISGHPIGQSQLNGFRAFVWQHGRMSLLPSLRSPYSAKHEDYDAVAGDINNKGEVVGTLSCFFDGAWMGTDLQAVIWKHGWLQKIPRLSVLDQNTAIAINDAGQVAGTADDDMNMGAPPHLYLFDKGKCKDLGNGTATGLNQAGVVSGYVLLDAQGSPAYDSSNTFLQTQVHALLCNGLNRQTLDGTYALCLNNANTVVGVNERVITQSGPPMLRTWVTDTLNSNLTEKATFTSDAHGSTEIVGAEKTEAYQHSSIILWRTPANTRGVESLPFHWLPQAINDAGQIVGSHWLWQKDHAYDLNQSIPRQLGWNIICATAINKSGMIAGYGELHGRTRAFLMTPD